MKYPLKILLLAVPLALVPALHANLIVNGSFETGIAGWTFVPAEAGSYCVVSPTLENFGHTAQDGTYAVAFGAMEDCVDTVQQAFSTVIGQSYGIDFWVHNTAGWAGSSLLATWNSAYLTNYGVNPFPISADMASFDWTHYNFTEVATSAFTTIAFSGLSYSDWIMVDNISVVALGSPDTRLPNLEVSTSVPDTGPTVLLLGLGLVALARLRRGRGWPGCRPVQV